MSTDAFSSEGLTELLQRVHAGDPSAREEVFRRAGRRLEAIARKMLRGFPEVKRWEQTNDVLSRAVITLLKALENVHPASTREFLGLVSCHVRWALLRLKKELIESSGGPGYSHQTPGAYEGEWPPAVACTNQSLWQIQHLVEQLPGPVREVFEMHFYHGLPKKEIASLLEVDVKTVQRRWHAAQEQFEALLSDGAGL
jgi:DNA-directed RNA polymerase specialized sigma24 family protein